MNRKVVALIAGAAVVTSLFGCATFQKPANETLSSLPVITFGEQVPVGKDYILFFPAGKPIKTTVSIKGTVFEKEAENTLEVTLKRDLYTYKRWISYDRNTWIYGNDAIDIMIELKVPGYGHPEPGIIAVRMNDK